MVTVGSDRMLDHHTLSSSRSWRSSRRDDHWGKIAPMAESWEVLTLRGLASADERAQEFTGTLVIHRLGAAEPVESVQVTIKRSVLTELHDTLGRLLARSTGIARRQT
jgi:hypothetical protein